MRRLLHEIILRIERHGAVLAAIAAVRQQETGLRRIAELRIQNPFELFAQKHIVNRAGDLHAAVEVARHEIGGRNIILRIFIASELINTAMLQKAADNTGDMDVFRLTGHTRQDAADAADDELNFHARARCIRQLVDDLALGDGVRLDAEGRSAELLIFPVQLC